MMKNAFRCLLFLTFLISAASCEKEELENSSGLEILYQTYQDGEISACSVNGKILYTGSQNVVDSPTKVYDQEGNQVGECNYAWGKVDAICEQLTACEVIYRVEGHISGEPAVDKYGLGR